MLTCTWAPTVFAGMQLNRDRGDAPVRAAPRGAALQHFIADYAARLESWGVSHVLIAQRWWGSGEEMEGSSHDCLAMTTLLASCTQHLNLITAIHPGFFAPTAIAKWGATLDAITEGRWAINVTSGWNMTEFEMYGIDPLPHDARYARSSEFISVLRGAWDNARFDFDGSYYRTRDLRLEPRPANPLTIYQGGQSDAAIAMAAAHSDWMFLNGGNLERTAEIIAKVRAACSRTGRRVRFALHANPLVRATDAAAWAEIDARIAALDPARVAQRRASLAGAQGMWSTEDALSMLDSNEGFAARLIGSPVSVLERIQAFAAIGVDMLHLTLADPVFVEQVLPAVHAIASQPHSTDHI